MYNYASLIPFLKKKYLLTGATDFDTFWDNTPSENLQLIEANNYLLKQKRDLLTTAIYGNIQILLNNLASGFSSKIKPLNYEDVFGNVGKVLTDEEKYEIENQKRLAMREQIKEWRKLDAYKNSFK